MSRYWPTSWSRRVPGPMSEDERAWREHDERFLRNKEKRLLDLPCMCYNGTGPHLSGCPKNPRNITRQPEPRASRAQRASCGRDPRHCDEWRCCIISSI